MNIKLLHPDAVVPTRGTSSSAGLDLYAIEDTIIYPGDNAVIPTGIAIEIPNGWFGLLTHRSSLAFKVDTIASLGIIDSDYRGEIKGKVFNLGKLPVSIKKGSRFAQIVFHQHLWFSNFKIVDELSTTKREGGMGSTGI